MTAEPVQTELSRLLWSRQKEPRIDQVGRVLTASSLHDKVVVLAFVSTDCLINCVVWTQKLDGLVRALPEQLRNKTAFIAAAVDAKRDDVAALRRFADGVGIDAARLRLVTGDEASTTALIASLRYPSAKLPEPPSTVLVFDRRGKVAMTYSGDPLDGPRLLRDIALLGTFENGIGLPSREAAFMAIFP